MSSFAGNAWNRTVFVVSDKPAARQALSRLLRSQGFEVLTFPSAKAFSEQVIPSTAGCLVLQISGTEQNAFELERAVSGDSGRPTIFIADRANVRLAVRAMKAGAVDFLVKPVASEDLLEAIHVALRKDHHMRLAKAELHLLVAEFKSFERRLASLTSREREVLRHLLSGERNKEIAYCLGITEKTVKVHRARVIVKMGEESLAGLVRAASQRGIGLGLRPNPAPAAAPQSRATAAS